MKTIKRLCLLTSLFLVSFELYSQSTVLGNIPIPGAYLGWSTPTSLFFRTNYAAAPFGAGNRMIIIDGGFGFADGRIAMGNSLVNGFAPQDRLHLHQTAGLTATRYSNGTTGSGATDGFQVGIVALGGGVIQNYEPSRPVSIGTNDGVAGTAYRMRVHSFADNGFISMGNVNNFPAAQSMLHIMMFAPNMANTGVRGEIFRTDGDNTTPNAWRMFTGLNPVGSTEKFSVIIPTGSNDATLNAINGDMLFYTSGASGVRERIHVSSGLGNTVGVAQLGATKVNISYGATFAPITNPVALLNLGFNPSLGPVGGQRAWMDVGTYTCGGSENMYIGLKNEDPAGNIDPALGADRMDAVVNWGDNNGTTPPFGPDRLRFIFTNVQNPAQPTGAASNNGLEFMRMIPVNNTTGYVGIGGDPALNLYSFASIDPGNTLEVNSLGATNVAGGSSGLRFTNLTAASPNTPNVANGNVLSVDADGDVILVPGATGGGFAGACTNPAAVLAAAFVDDMEQMLNGNDLYFSGQTAGTDNIAMGLQCGNPILGKLHVERQYPGVFAYANSAGVYIRNNDISQPGINLGTAYGVFATVDNTNRNNIGGFFTASNGSSNTGVQATITFASTSTNAGFSANVSGSAGSNIGVSAAVTGTAGTFNTAGQFSATTSTNVNRGVVGTATGAMVRDIGGQFSASGSVENIAVRAIAFGAAPGFNYALYADGDIFVNTSNFSGSGYVVASDVMFKENIDSVSNALSTIMTLIPRTYNYDTANVYGMNFDSHQHFGFIAQEVETVLPSVVGNTTKPAEYDSLGNVVTASLNFKTVNYNDMIALLTKGIQEQQAQIDSLQNQISSCCSTSARTANPGAHEIDVTLNNKDIIVLNQNTPNPFAEQTTITYFLPESTIKAQMLFYDANGRLIQAVDLDQRGNGQLNVFADDLSNGIYSYALVADGQVIDTKQMVKTK